jgi:hypothetical protein
LDCVDHGWHGLYPVTDAHKIARIGGERNKIFVLGGFVWWFLGVSVVLSCDLGRGNASDNRAIGYLCYFTKKKDSRYKVYIYVYIL